MKTDFRNEIMSCFTYNSKTDCYASRHRRRPQCYIYITSSYKTTKFYALTIHQLTYTFKLLKKQIRNKGHNNQR